MTQKFVNNFRATVAQTFGAADTYLYLSSAAGLPALGDGDYLLLTLFRKSGIEESGHEVIKVTAITDNMLTVQRAVEGAAASLFNVGDHVEARVTAKSLQDKEDAGVAASAVTAHESLENPHTQYAKSADVALALSAKGFPLSSVVTGSTQAAEAGNHYILTSAAATTVTLPGSPTTGDIVVVTVANGRTDNVVARNGELLQGLAEDMTLDQANASVWLRYIDTIGWRIV